MKTEANNLRSFLDVFVTKNQERIHPHNQQETYLLQQIFCDLPYFVINIYNLFYLLL